MPKYREITILQLKRRSACFQQVQAFKQLFGTHVNVTIKRAEEVATVFDWRWAAYAFLKRNTERKFTESVLPAWEKYQAKKTAMEEDYEYSPATGGIKRVRLHHKFYRKRNKLLAEYQRVMAKTFAKLYIEDKG
jgi:hypothetical protein